jgi:hypothetical protein
MLIETEAAEYKTFFPDSPHPFISEGFMSLNSKKVERVIRLLYEVDKPQIGLIAGVKNQMMLSPFSAPFGGFHFKNENVYVSVIDKFINSVKKYIATHSYKGIELVLPPDIYNMSFNAKVVNSLIRQGFGQVVPEITNWIDLSQFTGSFKQKNSREYYRQALRNGLDFCPAEDIQEKLMIYTLIAKNRARMGRPIYMTFDDILETGKLWKTDFFKVSDPNGSIIASAIFYRFLPEIGYAVFWGDSEQGRPLRAMDFLVHNLWNFYKDLGYRFLDMGISTESGLPNEGLLRFKESHDIVSSLRYRFIWKPEHTK